MLCGASSTARAGPWSLAVLRVRPLHHQPYRCFAHHATNDGVSFSGAAATDGQGESQRDSLADAHRNGIFMGIVATRTPQSTTIEQLLAHIQPRPVGRATQRNSTNSLLTLFLTPTFAQHAMDTKLPLRVLQCFAQHGAVSKPLDAVVAVVDRLPTPGGAPAGDEGLAYAFLTNPDPLRTSTQTPLQMSAQKPGSLSFEMPSVGKGSQPTTATVHVPLAQTTFSNGLPSTLIHSQYEFDPTTVSLRESISKRLESQVLPVPFGNTLGKITYDMPFTPLTPVRKVMSSMGNIIRKLSPHYFTQEQHLRLDPAYRPEPSSFLSASQELETAVSDHFKLLGLAPEPVQVWALILPDQAKAALKSATDLPATLLDIDRSVLETFWTDPNWKGCWSMRHLDIFRTGCRLARVLSGGGGWGKKAGLLSLDPDTGYSTRDLRSDDGWQFAFEDEYTDEAVADQQRQALGEIIKPGENVMFFLAAKHPMASLLGDVRYANGSDRAMTLGAIPSSIDDLPVSLSLGHEDHTSLSSHIEHFHDAFGILSEGGMAVTLTNGKDDNEVRTKIDVPFGNLKTSTSQYLPGTSLGQYLVDSATRPATQAGNESVPEPGANKSAESSR